MTMAELPIPSPHISEMSQVQLRTLVEELVKTHSRNGERLNHGVKDNRPSWWPPDVAWINPHIRTRRHSQQQVWSEALRKVVRSCYKHHGQEHRLQNTGDEQQEDEIRLISMTDDPLPINSNYEANMPAIESRLAVPVPTSGPIPAKAISRWKKNDFPNVAALPEAEAATANDAQTDDKAFMEIFICFYCEKEFDDRDQLQGHQQSCCPSRTRAQKTRKKVLKPRYKCKDTHPDTYKRPNHKVFVDAVGLIPRSKLAAFQKQKSKEEVKFDDIEIDECPIPKTPTTPRSKSLMSQLSRDLSPPPSNLKLRRCIEDDLEESEEIKCKPDNKDNADSESVCSDKSDSVQSEFNMRKIPSLLAIDLCSPLGQRVKKHVDKLDSSERTEYEDFCHTPVKNNALDRLRNRPPLFPVTFRKNKRLCPPQCHWYKFTKRDRREFMRVVATGLTRQARRLKRLMKPCKVRLVRLKEKDIVEWTTPRKHPRMIQQITGGMHQNQMWQFVTQQDGPRVYLRNPYQQQQMLMQQRGERQQMNHLMRMGNMPLKPMNPTPHSLVQNRSYKAVLSNGGRQPPHLMPQGGVPPLNVLPLPLSCPSNNRNFGKPLQPGGFYGPSPMRGQAHGHSSRPFHRPNILSKENGAMRHNGTVRRLTMDSPAKSGDLTAEYLQQLPSSVPCKKPEDDVISISSSESESETITNNSRKRPHPEDRNNNAANKRPRLSAGSGNTQVVLFRCHLCQAEITCKLGQTDFIKKHFTEKHAVNNIHLLEHMDSNNQKVVTIVEDNSPKPGPRSGTGPAGKNPSRLSNGSDMTGRNLSMSGRLGPGAIQNVADRAVLRDSHHGHSRSSDGKTQRTNVLDSGPPEIIILD